MPVGSLPEDASTYCILDFAGNVLSLQLLDLSERANNALAADG
jgi:hypothetical protein